MKFLNCLCVMIAMVKLLPAAEEEWQLLFDGKSLAGWTSMNGKAPGEGWKVVDGILHLDGEGGSIISAEEYSSFEMEWQWKIDRKGNNGIKYWVTNVANKEWLGLEYQMIDDGAHGDGKPGTNRATASIYDIKAAAADKPLLPAGEWNQSRVVVKEGKIQHFLNGKMVVEADTKGEDWQKQVAASKFRNKPGFAPGRGKIMLTDHKDPVWLKGIRIRRL